ncbi:unnamed protein product [Allacma fusca]|uniref:CUB domain-containing protein n=1 Tax=Allacma fusca TaxID=39272 RepID=A0A8J2KSN2_9HEXA|nr:unnamed protein product [Allacma fusca]
MKFVHTVALVATILSILLAKTFATDIEYEDLEDYQQRNISRDGRLFPFVAVVRFGDETCTTTTNGLTMTGSCRTQKQCEEQDGTVISGSTCGGGYGVCCTFRLSCPSSSSGNNIVTVRSSGTHIVSSNSLSMSTPTPCQINFQRPSKDICEVRLDFINFNIAGPNEVGDCNRASLTVMADNLQEFITCGSNTGQHLYLDYGQSDLVSVNINPNTDNNPAPVFDLQATYIRCNNCTGSGKSKSKKKSGGKKKNSGSSDAATSLIQDDPAPLGCDQYYTGTSGQVRSFNYMSTSTDPNAQNQINTEMYMVCVKTPPGSKKIVWSPCPGETNPFDITGGDSTGKTGSDCQTDYIDIPGSPQGRYCGGSFPDSVISSARPFQMYVYFNGEEIPGINNMINPTTGCPIGYDCLDQYSTPIIPGQGSPPNDPSAILPCQTPAADALGEQCALNPGLIDFVDTSNNGFCLQYTIM